MGIQSVSQLGGAASPPSVVTPQGNSPAAGTDAVAQAVTTQPVSKEQSAEQSASLEQALKKIEVAVQAKANNLQFSVDESTGKTVVRVIDGDTGSTIRQFPTEEALAIARDIDRMQGILLRDSA